MAEALLKQSFSHLAEGAAMIAESDNQIRKDFIRQPRWVGYPQAQKILDRLEGILNGPRVDRMECMLIVGETNNGKSRIIRHFMEKHPPRDKENGGGSEHAVLMIQAPPVPDEKRLYASILSRLGSPVTGYQSTGLQYLAVEKVLRGVNLKMLIIDEIQHLISGSTNKHRECLTALKFLSNDLQISLVGAGIRTAHYALANFDPQLENRFKPILLPRWNYGEELARLLMSFEKLLPLRRPSNLAEPKVARAIADLCDGKIGEIWTLLGLAAIEAIESEKECIDLSVLKRVESIAPTHRKALLHGTE